MSRTYRYDATLPHFTGKDQDTVANLYDFPARKYGIQGRWPSPDPAGLAAANLAFPQSWNRYAYVRNSPLSLLDPFGWCDELTTSSIDQETGAMVVVGSIPCAGLGW